MPFQIQVMITPYLSIPLEFCHSKIQLRSDQNGCSISHLSKCVRTLKFSTRMYFLSLSFLGKLETLLLKNIWPYDH